MRATATRRAPTACLEFYRNDVKNDGDKKMKKKKTKEMKETKKESRQREVGKVLFRSLTGQVAISEIMRLARWFPPRRYPAPLSTRRRTSIWTWNTDGLTSRSPRGRPPSYEAIENRSSPSGENSRREHVNPFTVASRSQCTEVSKNLSCFSLIFSLVI